MSNMGSNSNDYDVVVKLHEAPGRVSSSMKLQQAAAAAAPGPPGCCRSSPSSSYLQTQNQSRSLGVASSEIVQLHHHRHHHHLHGSLSLQDDDDPESLMPSEFNKQLVSKTTSFHIPESGTFPLTFAPGTYFHRDRRWRSPFSITQLRASSSSRRSLHHSWNLAWILTKCMQRTHSLQTDCSNSPCFASNDSTVEEEEEGSSSVFIGRHQSSRIMHCTCCCGCWRSESDFCCCGLWCARARSRAVDDQLQEPPPRESYYASSDSSSVKDFRDVMEEQQWNLHSDPMGLTMQIGARSAAASSSSVLPIVLKARTLSTTLLR